MAMVTCSHGDREDQVSLAPTWACWPWAREGEEKPQPGQFGLFTGEQASRQACVASGLCPLGRFGPGSLGLKLGLSCDSGPHGGLDLTYAGL